MKAQKKEPQADNTTKNTSSSSPEEIKTDRPISEKDEVKDAEKRTQKASKDNS